MRRFRKVAALILPIATALGCSSSDSDTVDDRKHTLVWRKCSTKPKTKCAELKVPSSYSEEDSKQINPSINRLKTKSKPADGVLLLTPGGPGGSVLKTEFRIVLAGDKFR